MPGSPQFPHDPNGPAATFAAAVVRLAAVGQLELAGLMLRAHHVAMTPSADPSKYYELHLTLHDGDLTVATAERESIEEALGVVSAFRWKLLTKQVPSELVRIRRAVNTQLVERGLPELVDVRYRERPGGGSHNVAVHRSSTDWDAVRETDELLFELGKRQTAWVKLHDATELSSPHEPASSGESARPVVFVSYSVADESYVNELSNHLAPIHRHLAEVWTFRTIDAGDDHHQVIHDYLESSAFGILMISARFLASDYVAEVELPKLTTGSRRLFAVIAGHCDHRFLTDHLYAPWGLAPLSEMTEPERDRIYAEVAVALRQALSTDT